MTQQDWFKGLRLQYYIAGRQCLFSGIFQMGRILLGYAVEAHLKAALALRSGRRSKAIYRHDIVDLLAECRQRGLFARLTASTDLIRYVDDGLNQRYPSQVESTLKRAIGSELPVSGSLSALAVHDDLILQLDDDLADDAEDPSLSIGLLMASTTRAHVSRLFFHSNAPAFARIDRYLGLLASATGEVAASAEVLRREPRSFWHYRWSGSRLGGDPAKLSRVEYAKTFVYPAMTVGKDEKGNVTSVSFSS